MRCVKLIGLFCTIFFAILVTDDVVAQRTTAEETEANNPVEETRFLSNIRQLTYDGKRAGEGYFSEDGNALIFQSEREPDNPFYQIYLLNLLTGDTHRVSTGVGKTTCAFFRPGTDAVLYASTHHDAFAKAKQEEELQFRASGQERRYSWDYDEAMDIFSAHRDGSNLKRLTDAPGYDAEASYSPDGKRIVFCSLRDAYPKDQLSPKDLKQLEVDPAYFGEIYIMNADGSDQTRLTDSPGYDGGPFFTPDGRHIVWRHFTPDGSQADIYTMRIDGSSVRRLTDFKSMSWAPYFHPSGAYVIFASNKLGFSNFELYLVDGRGRHEPVRVTATDGFDGLPVFSPDGNQLCWTSNRNSQEVSQLYLADWDHAAALKAIALAPRSHNLLQHPVRTVSNAESSNKTMSIRQHIEFLADDALEGRMTGSEGAKRAAEHIATQFTQLNLKPVGDEASYFQEFEFTAGRRIIAAENRFHITRQMHGSEQVMEYSVERDFQPLSFSRNGVVEGEVVFVGYGLTVPGELGEGYDAYAGLDVKDKIVVALRYVPEGVEPERRQQLNRYAGLRYKAMQAREQEAKAFFVVAGPNSPNAGKLIPLDFDSSLADSGIVAASISDTVANALFAPSGKNLKDVQSGLDVENPHFLGQFPLPGVKVKIVVSVEKVKKTDQNVVALLPPSELTDETEYIIVGAHYDHIGHGEIGSLARKGEEGQIHNGADDNASGTAVVLELATTLSEAYQKYPEKFRRGIIFALWSGEELGLIGSTHFVNDPVVPLEKVAAYINFDMVGRLRENKLILQGVGSSSVWTKLIEKRNIPIGFNLTLQEDPYLPTDVTAFYPKEVPVLSFFTGGHEDYNRPTDDPDTLNYTGIERIARLAHGIVLDLISAEERPAYVRVERSQSEEGSRDTLRAYLGTIPDYTTEGTGVKLSGVRAEGPADKAGLKGGDVIVEFGGQKITNIYDYTYALDAVKIGEPVEVVVLREGERVELTVTPEARN
ncbi:M28 family peptidase [Candidatus Poribacteria bacterium]|nr:M28 family peptidase [Candidatus Poribacteria bacterium]MYB02452.1 M28 family peptidase [Candidatus Poribacteria bacterium]